jgi:hypothetical protein
MDGVTISLSWVSLKRFKAPRQHVWLATSESYNIIERHPLPVEPHRIEVFPEFVPR